MDTIKRVQDLMKERDMNLCVDKKMRNIVFHDPNHCSSGRPVKRRDD